MRRNRIRHVAAACIAVALAVVCWLYALKPCRDAKSIAAAQDAVYEAVVRDMFTQADGQANVSQLVFSKEVLTGLRAGEDTKSCRQEVQQNLRGGAFPPPFNSLADKAYRLLTRGEANYSVRPDTVQDFAEKYCTGGRLSETFHTDLPRAFVGDHDVYLDIVPTQQNGPRSFAKLFPGASGIISFSHVGFDRSMDQAIVFSSFVCGMLCGTGKTYVLTKNRGRWKVLKQWVVWVS